jgi:hypothetical protein
MLDCLVFLLVYALPLRIIAPATGGQHIGIRRLETDSARKKGFRCRSYSRLQQMANADGRG